MALDYVVPCVAPLSTLSTVELSSTVLANRVVATESRPYIVRTVPTAAERAPKIYVSSSGYAGVDREDALDCYFRVRFLVSLCLVSPRLESVFVFGLI